MGKTDPAFEYCKQSMVIAQEIGSRRTESFNLWRIGRIAIQKDQWSEAIRYFNQAIGISDEIGNTQIQMKARYGLALAYLFSSNLADAHTIIEEACKYKYNYPFTKPNLLALVGLVRLRIGEVTHALEAFTDAVIEAEMLLGYCRENYKALDAQGLALCGLVMCEKNRQHIQRAVEAFQTARKINRDPGYLKDLLRQFDEMTKEDQEGMLTGVREYIGASIVAPT